MMSVDPIKNPDTIYEICKYLKATNDRNYILFLLGIYSGLRITDILSLRVGDVNRKTHITLKERKTGKTRRFLVNDILRRELRRYCTGRKASDWLIPSRQRNPDGSNRPICRDMALSIMHDIGELFGVDNLGCHSMRKTFGYHYYKQTGDIATLQKIFNHSSPQTTLRYLGIEQEDIDASIRKFRF